MAIQWFPGHMHVTRKAIQDRMAAGLDAVIELLDARLPGSSENPLLAELTRGKPALKLLNKQDLADPARTTAWLAHFQARPATRALATDAGDAAAVQRLIEACRDLIPGRGGMAKPLRVLICGVPNVGKSTLINSLAARRAAKTGDEPGITKMEQKIVLASDFYLFDTPGMLWPKIMVPESGYHLAASGAVGRNALDEEEVALELLERLRLAYPASLNSRYHLAGATESTPVETLLESIGKNRGAVMRGGRINLQKAAELLLHDFRRGDLGRVTLETPEQLAGWARAAQATEAARPKKRDKR